jgi:predicted amidohydrolase YtcJ
MGRINGLERSGLLGCLLALAACQHIPPDQGADTIFVNGKVFTADASRRVVQAFAVKGDRFLGAGSNASMRALAGPRARVVDLQGRFVSPGLTDAHLHSEGGGDQVDLSRVRNLAELYAAVAKRVAEAGAGALVMTNTDWHEMQLVERRLPTARELDAISPNNPVVLIRGGHSYILNSAALKRWNITEETPPPPGGQISKDASGNLTGELFDNAKSLVSLPPPPPVDVEDVVATHRALNRYGVTSAADHRGL